MLRRSIFAWCAIVSAVVAPWRANAQRTAPQRLPSVETTARPDPSSANGFAWRRRTANGTFLDSTLIARIGVEDLSAILVRLRVFDITGNKITMRTIFARPGRAGARNCPANFYVDGLGPSPFSALELDARAPLARITGIEVYDESFVPPQFQSGLSGCGSVVIWTH